MINFYLNIMELNLKTNGLYKIAAIKQKNIFNMRRYELRNIVYKDEIEPFGLRIKVGGRNQNYTAGKSSMLNKESESFRWKMVMNMGAW